MSPTLVDTALAQEGCLSNREIQAAISEGRLAPLGQVMASAGVSAKPLDPVRVCGSGGSYYYELNVIDQSGATQSLRLNAGGR